MHEEIEEKNPQRYLRALIRSIEDHMLPVTRYPEDSSESYIELVPVACDQKMAVALGREFDNLLRVLVSLGKRHKELEEHDNARQVLTPAELLIWENLIIGWKDPNLDPEEEQYLYDQNFYGELSWEEAQKWEEHCHWFEEACRQRLPDRNCSSVKFIEQILRFERLVLAGIPQIIMDLEGRRLAEEMLLYFCRLPE